MAGAKVKETVTKSLGKLKDEIIVHSLRTGTKSRAKVNGYRGKTHKAWGDQEHIISLEKGFMFCDVVVVVF